MKLIVCNWIDKSGVDIPRACNCTNLTCCIETLLQDGASILSSLSIITNTIKHYCAKPSEITLDSLATKYAHIHCTRIHASQVDAGNNHLYMWKMMYKMYKIGHKIY